MQYSHFCTFISENFALDSNIVRWVFKSLYARTVNYRNNTNLLLTKASELQQECFINCCRFDLVDIGVIGKYWIASRIDRWNFRYRRLMQKIYVSQLLLLVPSRFEYKLVASYEVIRYNVNKNNLKLFYLSDGYRGVE